MRSLGRIFLCISIFKTFAITKANGNDLSISGFSAYAGQTNIVLQASDNIRFTGGALPLPSLPAGASSGQLIIQAGNNITVGIGTAIIAGAGWSITMKAPTVDQAGTLQANSVGVTKSLIEIDASQKLILEASSTIIANGDSTAASPSAAGSVTIRAGDTFSDEPGSVINVTGATHGGNGGHVEISAPQMGTINTVVNGQAQNGFTGGTLTIDPSDIWLSSANSDPSAPPGYSVVNVDSFSGMSQINIEADDDIALNAIWQLTALGTPSTLTLTAGNDITLEPGAELYAGQGWTLNLIAGTGFVPTTAQPTPASGSDGIYLDNNSIENSLIQGYDGNINLWATNEVQVGWAGVSAGPGQVNSGPCSITTTGGGNINVTTVYGDVNTGSNPNGFDYNDTALDYFPDANLGGISTAAGGNVTMNAGDNVISYLPSGGTTAAEDGGTGAFGSEPGNVNITAGANVFGHYMVANGTGTITAGQNAGTSTENLALSLSSGGWSVNAPNGSIYLQEVRNPNGVFNNVPAAKRGGSTHYIHLFTYNQDAYVDLTANAVYLTGANVPRLTDSSSVLPILYPSILNINAGPGGVTLENNVTLFPSPNQNLVITTTGGGNLTATASLGNPFQLLMSDSAATQWFINAFSATDHGTLANEPSESSTVDINVSGSMGDFNLIATKVTDITVGGDMTNCSFSGQNLQSSDITSINVAGQIYNTSPYTFVTLSQSIPAIPSADLLPGMGNVWNNIFTLAINPSVLAIYNLPANTPPSQWASDILQSASLFPEQLLNGQLTGLNPGFVYDPTIGSYGRLGFSGQMSAALLSELSQPVTILQLVDGVPVTNSEGQFETITVSWADASDLQTLYNESQGKPPLSTVQPGYVIGGPGQFNITAGSISLGDSDGIISSGIYDPNGEGRYANLESITPVGATVNVTVTDPDQNNPLVPSLGMLSSAIASFDGGNVNVLSEYGSMDLGSPELISSTGGLSSKSTTGSHMAFGIYTTGGGDVSVIADGDVDIDGSRIGTYDGGNVFVESMTGNVNIGSGSSDLNTVYSVFSGEAAQIPYSEDVLGSGIAAMTLVPGLPNEEYPPNAATVPGNITVETPEGNIQADSEGILQESLSGTLPTGPTINLTAGTPKSFGYPSFIGNIILSDDGVIGGTINLSATGSIGEPALTTSISQSNGGVVISWNASNVELDTADAGNFEIESSTDLINWQVIDPAITTTANGGLSFEAPVSTNSSCFYRIQWQ